MALGHGLVALVVALAPVLALAIIMAVAVVVKVRELAVSHLHRGIGVAVHGIRMRWYRNAVERPAIRMIWVVVVCTVATRGRVVSQGQGRLLVLTVAVAVAAVLVLKGEREGRGMGRQLAVVVSVVAVVVVLHVHVTVFHWRLLYV